MHRTAAAAARAVYACLFVTAGASVLLAGPLTASPVLSLVDRLPDVMRLLAVVAIAF